MLFKSVFFFKDSNQGLPFFIFGYFIFVIGRTKKKRINKKIREMNKKLRRINEKRAKIDEERNKIKKEKGNK